MSGLRWWLAAAILAAGCNPPPADPGIDDGATGTDGSSTDSASSGGATSVGSTSIGFPPLCEELPLPTPSACPIEEDHPCSPALQDCPAGEKCLPIGIEPQGTTGTRCVPIPDTPIAIGEPCVPDQTLETDPCVVGAGCVLSPATGDAWCLEFCHCAGDVASCGSPGEACLFAGTAPLCLWLCDPLDGVPCPPGTRCTRFNTEHVCTPHTANFGVGEECIGPQCAAELACADRSLVDGCDGIEGCCAPVCDLGDPLCPPGTECTAATEFPAPCFERLGFCV